MINHRNIFVIFCFSKNKDMDNHTINVDIYKKNKYISIKDRYIKFFGHFIKTANIELKDPGTIIKNINFFALKK